MREIGIYVHIPFCVQKCIYCDFVSYANKIDLVNSYVEALKQEITKQRNNIKEEICVNTIYIGGGTPSYINSKLICDIISYIKKEFNIVKEIEITIEVNPGSVTESKLKDYTSAGVNRLSIGLQSTDNVLLRKLGRVHTYGRFLDTFNLARECGIANINVDLMIGIPNQTIDILLNSINDITSLEPEHISVYSLIVEEGTKLKTILEKGRLKLPTDEEERQMYWLVNKELKKKGYIHYEISNYAKRGYESKHNVDCWKQKEYLGFGVAAHSYFNNKRYSNTDSIEKYIKNQCNYTINEVQNKEAQMKEYMMLGLRKIKGVNISEFKEKFIENPIYVFRNELDKLVTEGLVKVEENSIHLTKKGIDLANLAWEEFV